MAVTHAPVFERPLPRNGIFYLALFAVWLTVASGAVVFSEPAPVDVLSMGLVLALPVVGLVAFRRPLLPLVVAFAVMAACALTSVSQSWHIDESAIHAGVSVYLYLTAIVLAAFVAFRPWHHTRLILHAFVIASVIAAMAGLAGYFHLVPGANELFTKFDRAAGTFKDPNVFGSFLVLALLYAIHIVMHGRLTHKLTGAAAVGVLGLAIVLSFSRGAWANLAAAMAVYGFLTFVTAPSHKSRITLLIGVAFTATAAMFALSVFLQTPEVSEFLATRAQLFQSYDAGPEGRFGGHLRAIGVILENPLGIGAKQFYRFYHPEDVHNVYLNTFVLMGWLGGFAYLLVILATLVFGLGHAIRRTTHQEFFIVAYAAFVGLLVVGFVVDTDHWRHFYLVLALLWGMMSAPRSILTKSGHVPHRPPRILSTRNRSPDRGPRIIGLARKKLRRDLATPHRRRRIDWRPRRPARIAPPRTPQWPKRRTAPRRAGRIVARPARTAALAEVE